MYKEPKMQKHSSKDHWEMKYSPCPYENTNKVKGSEWEPKRSSERVTTYNKVNEQDH